MLIYILMTYQSPLSLSPLSHPNKYLSLTNNKPAFTDCAYPIELTEHKGITLANNQLCVNGENITIHCTDKNVTDFKVENSNKYVMLKNNGKCLTIVKMIDQYLPTLDDCSFLDSQLFVVGDGTMCESEGQRLSEPVITYGSGKGVQYYEDGGLTVDCDNLDEAMKERYKDRCKVAGEGGEKVVMPSGGDSMPSGGDSMPSGGTMSSGVAMPSGGTMSSGVAMPGTAGGSTPANINNTGTAANNTGGANTSGATTVPITVPNTPTAPQSAPSLPPVQPSPYTQLLPVAPTATVTLSPINTPSLTRPVQVQQNKPNECLSPCVFRIEMGGRGVCICYNTGVGGNGVSGSGSAIGMPGFGVAGSVTGPSMAGGVNTPAAGPSMAGSVNTPTAAQPSSPAISYPAAQPSSPAISYPAAQPSSPAISYPAAQPSSPAISYPAAQPSSPAISYPAAPTNPTPSLPFQLPFTPSNTNIQPFKIPTVYLDDETFKSLKMSAPSQPFHMQCCSTMACPCIPIINVYPIINLDVEGLFRKLKDRMRQ